MLVIILCNIRVATVLRQTFCNIALTDIDNTLTLGRFVVPDDVYALLIITDPFQI